jgi:hypothetical protein
MQSRAILPTTGLAPYIHSFFCRRFHASEENLVPVHHALGFIALDQPVPYDPKGARCSQTLRRNAFGEHPLRNPARQNIEQRTHAVVVARRRMAVATSYDEGAGVEENYRTFAGGWHAKLVSFSDLISPERQTVKRH